MSRLSKAFDWTLGVVAPVRAMRRQHLRLFETDLQYREVFLAGMRAAGYRAAKNKTGQTPWVGGTNSADAEIAHDLPTLRNRSRELNRDDPLASGVMDTIVRNVIGTGMRAQAITGDDTKDTNIEEVWNELKDTISPADGGLPHGEMQAMVCHAWLSDGDVLRKATKTASAPREPVWCETIESDRLQTPMDKVTDGNIREGVERDKEGRTVAYWITKHHPGETIAPGMLRPHDQFIRVEKSEAAHLFTQERPGQSRGVPIFHAILQDLRDLDLLIIAGLKRAQIAACLSVFIKSEGTLEDMFQTTAKTYGYQIEEAIEPGMIFKLYPSESIETLIPNFPTPELAPFIIMLARRIGAALGVSWQVVLKDFGDSTYSSARTDLLESRMTYKVLGHAFVEKFLNWEWFLVLSDARLRGDRRLRGVTDVDLRKVSWIMNGWQWVDPLKEAKANEIAIESGIKTKREVCAERGMDWEEVLRQRLREEKTELDLRVKMGLPAKEPDEPSAQSGNGNGNGGGGARSVEELVESMIADAFEDIKR